MSWHGLRGEDSSLTAPQKSVAVPSMVSGEPHSAAWGPVGVAPCHALRAHVNLERPRLLGRPPTSVAASQAEAGWRQRVSLKRPVRAHRTPGAGRGRSGTWPSNRDACATVHAKYGTSITDEASRVASHTRTRGGHDDHLDRLPPCRPSAGNVSIMLFPVFIPAC